MRFIALSLFLLHAKFHAFWCRHDKVTASDRVGRFFETQCWHTCGVRVDVQVAWLQMGRASYIVQLLSMFASTRLVLFFVSVCWSVGLSVSLSVSLSMGLLKSYGWIFVNFFEAIGLWKRSSRCKPWWRFALCECFLSFCALTYYFLFIVYFFKLLTLRLFIYWYVLK